MFVKLIDLDEETNHRNRSAIVTFWPKKGFWFWRKRKKSNPFMKNYGDNNIRVMDSILCMFLSLSLFLSPSFSFPLFISLFLSMCLFLFLFLFLICLVLPVFCLNSCFSFFFLYLSFWYLMFFLSLSNQPTKLSPLKTVMLMDNCRVRKRKKIFQILSKTKSNDWHWKYWGNNLLLVLNTSSSLLTLKTLAVATLSPCM